MLDTRDLIILTAAFYLGGVVSRFFSAFTDGIVMPLVGSGKGVQESTVTVGGVTLKTGELLASTFQLVVSFIVVVYLIGVLRTYFLSRIGAARGGVETK